MLVSLIFLSSFAFAGPSPSFPCEKASSAVEKSICATDDLAATDAELAKAYLELQTLTRDSELKTSQKSWLASRNKCAPPEIEKCLRRSYSARRTQLESMKQKTHSKRGQNYSLKASGCEMSLSLLEGANKLTHVSIRGACGAAHHTCDFEGEGLEQDGVFEVRNRADDEECVVSIQAEKTSAKVSVTDSCNASFCGLNAFFDGDYKR